VPATSVRSYSIRIVGSGAVRLDHWIHRAVWDCCGSACPRTDASRHVHYSLHYLSSWVEINRNPDVGGNWLSAADEVKAWAVSQQSKLDPTLCAESLMSLVAPRGEHSCFSPHLVGMSPPAEGSGFPTAFD
jgi:hypothetical protein